MLDAKQSWDELVRRHAPNPATVTRILENPLYLNITGRFAAGNEYIAMERLYEIHRTGVYDLIVVDTPPTRHALDFLEAPDRMAEFFSSRLLRWLTARSRMVTLASRPFYQVADRVLGSQFLQDIAEFFLLFQTMYDGFVERSQAVKRLVHGRRTTFIVVTALEATPLREAEFFMDALLRMGLHPGALVLNKVLPSYLLDPGPTRVAERLRSDGAALAAGLPPDAGEPAVVTRVLREVGESFLNFGVVAKREAEQRAELATRPDVMVAVPFFETDIYDLAGLLRHGSALWAS
jgi:anion-transporting  ArsA/GET3 family ATPase